jgi:hypothetical protein
LYCILLCIVLYLIMYCIVSYYVLCLYLTCYLYTNVSTKVTRNKDIYKKSTFRFFIFIFFVRFSKVPNFRILQFLKYFFIYTNLSFFHWNSHILINNLQTLVVRGQVNFNYWIEEYILNDFKTFSFA